MAETYLDGVAIGFYRGIGEVQRIGPFSDVNFFIGPNNAGKSSVLSFIRDKLPFGGSPMAGRITRNSPEVFRGAKDEDFFAGAGVCKAKVMSKFEERLHQMRDPHKFGRSEKALTVLSFLCEPNVLWLGSETRAEFRLLSYRNSTDLHGLYSPEQWEVTWRFVTGSVGTAPIENQVKETVREIINDITPNYPRVTFIPSKRKIVETEAEAEDSNVATGDKLISILAKLNGADWNEAYEKKKFDKINVFLKTVVGKPDAEIRIPHDRKHLLVHMDNKVLPLENLGTGIHEVILIAAFCTIHNEQIICIEEPEIHLHPTLQRKLIRYLQENTDNQYFIATHSAAFIDTPGASVFRVHNDGVQTYVEPALLNGDKWQICEDLGYRASDILQANMVIWVEGPSDRIYLNHWIAAVDPNLIEGTHYTLMFYGGGLVSHLSAESEGDPLGELIDLRSLNKNMAIVMDSDRDSDGVVLKPAAQRLIEEVTDERGFVWITKGREIENYVDYDDLQGVLKELHPNVYGGALGSGEYEHAFYFKRKGKAEPYKDANKVRAARRICEQPANLDVLDLRERVTELVALIRRANDSGDAQKQP